MLSLLMPPLWYLSGSAAIAILGFSTLPNSKSQRDDPANETGFTDSQILRMGGAKFHDYYCAHVGSPRVWKEAMYIYQGCQERAIPRALDRLPSRTRLGYKLLYPALARWQDDALELCRLTIGSGTAISTARETTSAHMTNVMYSVVASGQDNRKLRSGRRRATLAIAKAQAIALAACEHNAADRKPVIILKNQWEAKAKRFRADTERLAHILERIADTPAAKIAADMESVADEMREWLGPMGPLGRPRHR